MTEASPRRGLFARFGRDRRANVALGFALVAVALTGATGAAVDYSNIAGVRSRLQQTADARKASEGAAA